jgi:hypothetical protein
MGSFGLLVNWLSTAVPGIWIFFSMLFVLFVCCSCAPRRVVRGLVMFALILFCVHICTIYFQLCFWLRDLVV